VKAAFINPSMGDYYQDAKVQAAITLSPPLNLAVVAAAARRAGHAVCALDLEGQPEMLKEGAFAAWLRQERPDLVGISFRTPLFPQARRLAEIAREVLPDAMLVAGGVHPSTRGRETVTRAPFDVAVRGEGEEAIVELLDGRDPATVQGVTCRTGAETPARPLIPDLDVLPMPAWDLFDLSRYSTRSLVARTAPVADLESSRGCRARCVYCTKGVFGNQYRVKSPARMVDEVEHARAAGFRAFNLVDDSFTTLTSRSIAVCEELMARGTDMPWTLTNGIRVANVNEEFFRVARAAGCYLLAFGFESGSDEVLKRIKKGATTRQAVRAVAWARKYGFTILGYFMVGLPGETAETIAETARFAASLDVDYAKFSITMPLPGTPLYEQWRPYIRDESRHDFSIHKPEPSLYDHPDFLWEDLERHTKAAYRTFYGRPGYVAKRVLRSIKRGEILREARYGVDFGLSSAMTAFNRR